MTYRAVLASFVIAAVTLAACGGSETPAGPTDPPVTVGPTVLGVSPTSGPTTGGIDVTISGINFAAGAAVTIGGVAATNVRVVSATSLQATIGAHPAGAADVTVTLDGRSSTIAAAFTYVALPPPTLSAISPVAGPTTGGTTVTLTGTNFVSGATVSIGGVAATTVAVLSATSLTAVTGPRAAGAADVVVAVGTQNATLLKGFTYVVPGPNAPPVISSITVQSTQPKAPANFADVGENVPVTAAVTDAETPVSQLAFEWSATAGTFTGTGGSVVWKAPATAATPLPVTLTLKVTEQLGGTTSSQSTTRSVTVHLHNSVKEIAEMSYQFLVDFSQQILPPENVVRNFYTGCPGRSEELSDVTNNQKNYRITSYTVAATFPVTVSFSGTCPVRSRSGDGCAQVPVEWHSTCLSSDPAVCTIGKTYTTIGTDQTSAVYRQDRWWLCDSDFNGTAVSPFFIR